MGKTKKRKITGYTANTIAKVVSALKTKTAHYANIDIEKIKMCISDGNTKIGRVMNVSLPPMLSCGNCSECKHWCYDIKANLQYPNVVDARVRNWTIFLRNRDEFFNRIEAKIRRRRKHKYFRWHVSGDIVDLDHLMRIIAVARNYPEFVFWTYTKMYSIVNEYCRKYGKESVPSNLSIMFSEWRGLPMDNPFGFAEFRVHFEDEPIPDCYKCPGNCDICKKGNRGCLGQETTYNDAH